MSQRVWRVPVSAAFVLALAAGAGADDRRLVFSDEARVTPPGMIEFEQWVTWKTNNENDGGNFNVVEFKEELEFGVNQNLQVGLEVPAWHIQPGPEDDKDGPRLDAIAADVRWVVFDPNTNPIGLALKPEIGISEDKFELAGRAIVQKNFDKIELVYNATLEASWNTEDGDSFSEEEGEFVQTFGASFEFATKWFVGAEAVWEIPMPEWHTGQENQNFFVGPNISSHHTNWAATVAPLVRVSDSDEEPKFMIRAVIEVDF